MRASRPSDLPPAVNVSAKPGTDFAAAGLSAGALNASSCAGNGVIARKQRAASEERINLDLQEAGWFRFPEPGARTEVSRSGLNSEVDPQNAADDLRFFSAVSAKCALTPIADEAGGFYYFGVPTSFYKSVPVNLRITS